MTKRKPDKNRKITTRILLFLTVGIFVFFIYRFVTIMTTGQVDGKNLEENIEQLYASDDTLKGNRGNIYDEDGDIIATEATTYKLYAVLTDQWHQSSETPLHVVNKEKTARILSQYIAMEEDDILDRLNTPDVTQVEFGNAGNDLPFHVKEAIDSENIPGIFFEPSPKRYYPNGVFASHIIGLAQNTAETKENDLTGLIGLELQYEEILEGEDGKVEYQTDSFGYAIPGEEVETVEPKNGSNIYTTFDKTLQTYVENVVSSVYRDNPAEAITVTLMEAETGKVLSATQRPTFDATTMENINDTWQNFHTEYIFEPGSTFKIFSLAASIQEGVFDPYAYFPSGRYEVEGDYVTDVNPEGWGTISYLEGLARSSNTMFVRMAEIMGYDTWENYINAFQFGQPSQVNLPNNASGSNPYNSTLQKANTSFGQGISVTVMQMMQAFSAIANDGQMMLPQFVEKIENSETGEIKEYEPEVIGQPISEEAANATLEYLHAATGHEETTTEIYQLEDYEMALKTGTAQISDPETGQYMTGLHDHVYSVVGFAPATNPKYILYITVQQPTIDENITYGGQYVAEIFKPIMKWMLDYTYSTENVSDIESSTMPDITRRSTEEAVSLLDERDIETAVVGTGDTVVQQNPYPKESFISNQKAVIMTNGAMSMPDLTGWSKNDALKVSELTGVKFTFNGEGYISTQSLEPGRLLEGVDNVHFELTPE